MRSKKRTLVLAAAMGIAVLTGMAAWFARGALLEQWWIHRLSSDAPEVRAASVDLLRRNGRDAAALALAERVFAGCEKLEVEKDTVAALEAIFERVRPETRVRVTRKLVRCGSLDILANIARILDMASGAPETLDVLIESVEEDPDDLLRVAALAHAWPGARTRVEAWLARVDPPRLEGFLETLYSVLDLQVEQFDSWRGDAHARQALDDLARSHPRPEVRAISLVKAALAAPRGSEAGLDRDGIARAFAGDPEPLVRTAALKLAGVFAGGANVTYLKAVLLGEKDPAVLATAIGARTLAASSHDASDLLVVPGVVTKLRPVDRESLAFDAEEVLHLESILLESKDPAVREAASRALAVARSGAPAARSQTHRGRSGPEVREWSVWREEGAPPGSGREASGSSPELPGFVHRRQPGFDHLAASRVDSVRPDTVTARSAVFFRVAAPLVLTVRVGYLGGVPQGRYPEATNLLGLDAAGKATSRMGVLLEAASVADNPIDPAGEAYWGRDRNAASRDAGDRLDVTRPWEALGDFHQCVPWARSRTSVVGSTPRGFGLEWSGLRIGYGPELEGEMASVPRGKSPMWDAAREAGAARIAMGGDRERFLFHEGSALVPSPVVVEWEDWTRRAVVLRTRDFVSLPHLHDWEDFDFGSLLRRGERIVPSSGHVPAVFVIRKEPGKAARGICLRNLPSRSPPATIALDGLDLESGALRENLRSVLEREGLTRGESAGLLATCEGDLFDRVGVRMLTVVPRWLHDAVLPLEVTPAPEKVTRVGILWKECEGLEVRTPSPGWKADPFGLVETLRIETSRLDTRRTALEPGPPIPIGIGEDGLLTGIWPGRNTMMLSDDGRYIAHPREGLAGVEVYIGDLERKQFVMHVRLPPPLFPEDYTFCPDGSRVGMLVLDGDRYRVFVADIPGGALLEISTELGTLAWSHASRDGRVLSFLEDGKPCLFDFETNELRRVMLPPHVKAFYPMLTPDGRNMALILETTPEGSGSETKHAQIAVADFETKTLRSLANVSGTYHFPSISDDGRKVLFTRSENGLHWLYLADVDGSKLLRISPHIASMHSRGVTDNGSTVLFTNEYGIWATDLSTGASRLAYAPEGFRIRDGGISSSGRRALLQAVHPKTGSTLGVYYVDLE